MTEPSAQSPPREEPREKREWWVIDEHRVVKETGYSCAPMNPRVWWIPELGFSGTEDYQVFKTRAQAVRKLRGQLESDKRAIEQAIRDLDVAD